MCIPVETTHMSNSTNKQQVVQHYKHTSLYNSSNKHGVYTTVQINNQYRKILNLDNNAQTQQVCTTVQINNLYNSTNRQLVCTTDN